MKLSYLKEIFKKYELGEIKNGKVYDEDGNLITYLGLGEKYEIISTESGDVSKIYFHDSNWSHVLNPIGKYNQGILLMDHELNCYVESACKMISHPDLYKIELMSDFIRDYNHLVHKHLPIFTKMGFSLSQTNVYTSSSSDTMSFTFTNTTGIEISLLQNIFTGYLELDGMPIIKIETDELETIIKEKLDNENHVFWNEYLTWGKQFYDKFGRQKIKKLPTLEDFFDYLYKKENQH